MLHHVSGCACPCCMSEQSVNTTSESGGAVVTVTAEAGEPVYDNGQIITALTTRDGTQPSAAWQPDIITYSINIGQLDPSDPECASEMAGYVAMTAAMEAAATEAFELWDELIDVELMEMDDWASAHMTFNYSSNTGNSTYASYSYWLVDNAPRSQYKLAAADIWFADSWATHDDDGDLYLGGYAILTYLHEIGHALGVTHPGPYNGAASYGSDATQQQDTREYTVMSYFNAGADGSGTDHFGTNGWSYAATPLLHDILAIQAVYGADMTTRTGDTVYGFNSTAGRDAFDFTVNTNPVIAIWDAGGIDKIDASGWDTDQVIDLGEGAFSSLGHLTNNVAIAYGATIERAPGGGGDDVMTGNDADTDTIEGGTHNDVLRDAAGADVIDGGLGTDWAEYVTGTAVVTIDLAAGTGSAGEAVGDVLISIENVSGTAYDDWLLGDDGRNIFFGGSGADTIEGRGGNDMIRGEAGADAILAGAGDDTLLGGGGADILDGGAGKDWANYSESTAAVGASLSRGTGLGGDAAGDTFVGIEWLMGSVYDDILVGNGGVNIIRGGSGADRIRGWGGEDYLSGNGGDDVFVFAPGHGIDRVYDFTPGSDLLEFTGGPSGFGDLTVNDFKGDASVTLSRFIFHALVSSLRLRDETASART